MAEDFQKYLRFVSMCGLVRLPNQNKFIIGRRKLSDEFFPLDVTFPSGRVEGGELSLRRLQKEIAEETGIYCKVGKNDAQYLGECGFQRDGYPVTQYCFGVDAVLEYSGSMIAGFDPEKSDLKNIHWVTPDEFFEKIPDSNCQANLHRFVNRALEIGFLER